MGVFKNDVGRPSNKTIMTRNILKGILVIVLAAAIFAGGYLLNDSRKKEDKNTVNDIPNEKKEVSIKNAENVLYGTFEGFWNFSVETFNSKQFKTYVAMQKTKPKKLNYTCKELFGNDIESFDGSDSAWTIPYKHEGLEGLLCTDDSNNLYYQYDDVNKKYKELFGTDNALKDFGSYGLANNYGYSTRKNVYMFLSCECGDGGFMPIYGVTSAYEKSDKLYINFVYSIADDENRLYLSDDATVKLTGEELENKETYKKYADKLDKYTFIFTKNGNGYIFEKVK